MQSTTRFALTCLVVARKGSHMHPSHLRWQRLILVAAISVMCPVVIVASDEPTLRKDQIEQFLLTAKVIKSGPAHRGITNSYRLTLTDGTITHDAHFQPIDEHAAMKEMANGRREMNFVDSYKYNIAAYQLAEMLGLDDMVPAYVQRKWEGKTGSFSFRVLDQLVYDTDPNLTNVLIGEDWKIYRTDFSRAFRLYKDLQSTKDLVQCDRQLLAKLKALDGNELAARTKGFLNKQEVQAVMARREKIVDHFQKLIAEKVRTKYCTKSSSFFLTVLQLPGESERIASRLSCGQILSPSHLDLCSSET